MRSPVVPHSADLAGNAIQNARVLIVDANTGDPLPVYESEVGDEIVAPLVTDDRGDVAVWVETDEAAAVKAVVTDNGHTAFLATRPVQRVQFDDYELLINTGVGPQGEVGPPGGVNSVNDEQGDLVIDAAFVGADPAGTAATAVGTEATDRATADALLVPKADAYAATSTPVLRAQVVADSGYRVQVLADGKIRLGPGDGTVDVEVYRSGVSALRLDNRMGLNHNAAAAVVSDGLGSDGPMGQVVVKPSGDDTNGIVVVAPNATWGDNGVAATPGSALYATGQFLSFHRYWPSDHVPTGADTWANSTMVFRVDRTGGLGLTAAVHVATGLRQSPGYAPFAGVWLNPYMDVTALLSTPFTGQTSDQTVWQGRPGGVLRKQAAVLADGSFQIYADDGSTAVLGVAASDAAPFGRVVIQTVTPSAVGLILKGAATQSGEILQWKRYTDKRGAITGIGHIVTYATDGSTPAAAIGTGDTGDAGYRIIAVAIDPTTKALALRAAGSQTANLQENLNSGGNLMSGLDAAGRFGYANGAGGAIDVYLDRPSAFTMRCVGIFRATDRIYARTGTATEVALGNVGPTSEAGIVFNSDVANLYLSASGLLRSGGALQLDGAAAGAALITVDGNVTATRTGGASIAVQARVTGDAVARWSVLASGKVRYGDGTNAVDATMTRTAAGALQYAGAGAAIASLLSVKMIAAQASNAFEVWDSTSAVLCAISQTGAVTTPGIVVSGSGLIVTTDGVITSVRASASSAGFNAKVTGDSVIRYQVLADGTVKWGTGAATADATLSRTGVGVLKLVDVLNVGPGAVGGPSLSFYGDPDTGIWNSAADTVAITTAGANRFLVASGVITCNVNLAMGNNNITAGTSTGCKIGTGTTQKFGFWNVTPIVQPASANQAAVAATAATNVAPYGFTTAAQADGIITLLNQIRSDLVAVGLLKGSA